MTQDHEEPWWLQRWSRARSWILREPLLDAAQASRYYSGAEPLDAVESLRVAASRRLARFEILTTAALTALHQRARSGMDYPAVRPDQPPLSELAQDAARELWQEAFDRARARTYGPFYTAKALACMLCGLHQPGHDPDSVEVACWDVSVGYYDPDPSGTTLLVGRGIFSGWHYEIGSL